MDEKELEALKASNPKAYEHIMSLKGASEKDAKVKADAEAAAKAKADADKAAKGGGTGEGDEGLREKAAKERENGEGRAKEIKSIENALKFNLGVAGFVKENADILPSEITEILKAADKEKFDTAGERSNAVKTGFIQSFFAVQSNLDMLTASQKTTLDDYLKLTKKGKEDKAEFIYENVFEPALETLKKVRKAEELGKARSGFSSGSSVENGYKERLMNASKKTHLGEKEK